MPHYYCPCGSVVAGGSAERTLKCSTVRSFISIRTMQSISPEAKVCNTCRGAYYTWKNNNPEFGDIFSRVEQESSDTEEVINPNSVNKNEFFA